jgi:hypothetical protein
MTIICETCGQEVEEENPKDHWFCIMGIGTEGIEMLYSGQDHKKASSKLDMMLLRASFNSHRRIQVFTWTDCEEITLDNIDKQKTTQIMKYAKQVY